MSEISDNITLCDLKCVTGEDYRYYITPDGKKYYSTTTVVNWDKREFFKEWRKNNPNKSKIIQIIMDRVFSFQIQFLVELFEILQLIMPLFFSV